MTKDELLKLTDDELIVIGLKDAIFDLSLAQQQEIFAHIQVIEGLLQTGDPHLVGWAVFLVAAKLQKCNGDFKKYHPEVSTQ